MWRILSLLLCGLLLGACSPAKSTSQAAGSAAPSLTATSSPVVAPTVTTTPSVTATPTVTIEETVAPVQARAGLAVWHSFAENSPAEQTLARLVAQAQQAAPNQAINLLRLPADQLLTRFETESAAGGGPDLLIADGSSLGRIARAGLLLPVDDQIAASLPTLAQASVEGQRVDGKLYGVPLTRSTVALYYNAAAVPNVPASTQALLDLTKGGTRIVLVRSAFYSYGFFGAFGGRLFDDAGRCVADQGGFAEALAYLRELKTAGVQFVTSGSEAEDMFRTGQADITINGDWLLDDFRTNRGDQLAVAALPAGPAGPATPLISGSTLLINVNTAQAAPAFDLALFLSSAEAQQQFVDQARIIPANTQAAIADNALGGFAASALAGVARPQQPEMQAFWTPFDAALAEVLDVNVDPAAAVQAACAAMNAANGK